MPEQCDFQLAGRPHFHLSTSPHAAGASRDRGDLDPPSASPAPVAFNRSLQRRQGDLDAYDAPRRPDCQAKAAGDPAAQASSARLAVRTLSAVFSNGSSSFFRIALPYIQGRRAGRVGRKDRRLVSLHPRRRIHPLETLPLGHARAPPEAVREVIPFAPSAEVGATGSPKRALPPHVATCARPCMPPTGPPSLIWNPPEPGVPTVRAPPVSTCG